MTKITLITIATIFLAAAIFARTQAQPHPHDLPRIAVQIAGDFTDDEKEIFASAISASLERSGRYTVVADQDNARYVCVAEITPPFGTFRVVTPEFEMLSATTKNENNFPLPNWRRCVACRAPFHISAKIINIETGDTILSGTAENALETMTDLTQLADALVRDMFNDDDDDNEPAPPQRNRLWRR